MKKITIFVSGGSRGNPGPAAVGINIVDGEGAAIDAFSYSIGNATDDYACYVAIVKGLQTVVEKFPGQLSKLQCELRLDNQLVKGQLSAEEPMQHPGLVPYFIEVYNLRVLYFPELVVTYIPKAQNKEAARLMSEALDVQ